MVVPDQHHVGCAQGSLNILAIQNTIVGGEGIAELAEVFPPAVRILSPDFALHSRQRVQLRRASPGSQIRRR